MRYAIVVPRGGSSAQAERVLASLSSLTDLSEYGSLGSSHVLSNREIGRGRAPTGELCLLGTLFDKAWHRPVDADDVATISDAGIGRELWGHYVIARSNGRGRTTIIRDPSGGVPCYFAVLPDALVAVSHADLLFRAGLSVPELDMRSLSMHLVNATLRRPETCQAGLRELLPGTAIEIGENELRLKVLWSPWDFAKPELEIDDPTQAAAAVEAAINGSVAALARQFRHIILGVSGGLDSSIVAAAIKRAGTPMTCMTIATKAPSGDERHYSRILASDLDVPLTEAFEDLSLVDLRRSGAAHLPRPVGRAFAQSADTLQRRLAESVDADAFFHGGGGDNIFCYLTSVTPIADRLKRQGFRAAWTTAHDVVELTGCSIFQALRGGMRRAWFRPPAYRWPTDIRFLSGRLADLGPASVEHDWLRVPAGGLPGKAMHIAMLLGAQNYIEGFARERDYPVVAPLLAQPVVETCLRIPSWMWCARGQNRAVARRAFRSALPREIIERSVKGTPTSFSFELIERGRSEIGEILKKGFLAKAGLLDIASIEQALSASRRLESTDCIRLLSLVDVEAWVSEWLGQGSNDVSRTARRSRDVQDRHLALDRSQSSRLGT